MHADTVPWLVLTDPALGCEFEVRGPPELSSYLRGLADPDPPPSRSDLADLNPFCAHLNWLGPFQGQPERPFGNMLVAPAAGLIIFIATASAWLWLTAYAFDWPLARQRAFGLELDISWLPTPAATGLTPTCRRFRISSSHSEREHAIEEKPMAYQRLPQILGGGLLVV
jgi:hypothetical protein